MTWVPEQYGGFDCRRFERPETEPEPDYIQVNQAYAPAPTARPPDHLNVLDRLCLTVLQWFIPPASHPPFGWPTPTSLSSDGSGGQTFSLQLYNTAVLWVKVQRGTTELLILSKLGPPKG